MNQLLKRGIPEGDLEKIPENVTRDCSGFIKYQEGDDTVRYSDAGLAFLRELPRQIRSN